jgi:hypothetical protein
MRGGEAASANGQGTVLSRPRWEFDSPRSCQDMKTQVIELEGFSVEFASELYGERGGDHRELLDCARTDRSRLGHNVRCCACGA